MQETATTDTRLSPSSPCSPRSSTRPQVMASLADTEDSLRVRLIGAVVRCRPEGGGRAHGRALPESKALVRGLARNRRRRAPLAGLRHQVAAILHILRKRHRFLPAWPPSSSSQRSVPLIDEPVVDLVGQLFAGESRAYLRARQGLEILGCDKAGIEVTSLPMPVARAAMKRLAS